MKDQVIFDTTDADTIADSDKILSGIISTDGSTLITDTLEGGKQGLDVFVINTDLDVNLQDGAGNDITSTGGALDVNLASGSITINEEDIFEEDSAHTSSDKGSHILAVRQDTLASSVSADGDYASLKLNTPGALYVTDEDTQALLTTMDAVLDNILTDTNAMVVDLAAIEVELLDQGTTLDGIETTLNGLSHNEDDAHVSGDAGFMGLFVRNDAGTALAADGDYIPGTTDATGAIRVTDVGTGSDSALADTAIANAANTLAVANTAEDAVASPLASRKYLWIYNNDNKKIYVGASGVTTANGFPISPRAYMELRAGASVDIEYVATDAGSEIRTMELS